MVSMTRSWRRWAEPAWSTGLGRSAGRSRSTRPPRRTPCDEGRLVSRTEREAGRERAHDARATRRSPPEPHHHRGPDGRRRDQPRGEGPLPPLAGRQPREPRRLADGRGPRGGRDADAFGDAGSRAALHRSAQRGQLTRRSCARRPTAARPPHAAPDRVAHPLPAGGRAIARGRDPGRGAGGARPFNDALPSLIAEIERMVSLIQASDEERSRASGLQYAFIAGGASASASSVGDHTSSFGRGSPRRRAASPPVAPADRPVRGSDESRSPARRNT